MQMKFLRKQGLFHRLFSTECCHAKSSSSLKAEENV